MKRGNRRFGWNVGWKIVETKIHSPARLARSVMIGADGERSVDECFTNKRGCKNTVKLWNPRDIRGRASHRRALCLSTTLGVSKKEDWCLEQQPRAGNLQRPNTSKNQPKISLKNLKEMLDTLIMN